jgi:ABC-type sulfate/molybdate transport systems ATPase subunit
VGTRILLDTAEGIDEDPARRRLGYVAQRDGLFDHLDVEANIAVGLAAVERGERSRRIAELLTVTGLTRVRHQRPATLSAGERKRVALARALAPAPRALLLDEPFSSLDAPIRRQLRRLVREVHERTALPLVLVTHDRDDALDVADYLVVLDRGRVVQQGPIEQVFARPVNASVARLVGIPNILAVLGVEPESATTVRVRTDWGTLSVEAPQARAEAWSLAVPVDAVRADRDGTIVSIHSCRPAPGGWRLTLTSPGSGDSLEALMAREQFTSSPVPGARIGLRIAGERCHLMPSPSPDRLAPTSLGAPGDRRHTANPEEEKHA